MAARRLLRLLLVALPLLLAAGAGAQQYPLQLEREFANFPPRAAGFERWRIFAYAPGLDDVSVGYAQREPVPIVATLYFYKGARYLPVAAQQFEQEKATIEQSYAGARKLSEETITLKKGGREYPAFRATYRFSARFLGEPEEVYSELLFWTVGDHYVKLRSTARSRDGAEAAPRNRELLDAIDWTRPIQ